MTKIKESVKQILKRGSRVYAVVESFSIGKATIRLGKNGTGARLTNIPYSGNIEVGDIVLCTITNDMPMIHKLISPVEEEVDLLEAEASKQPGQVGDLITGKVTAASNQTEYIPTGTTEISTGFTKKGSGATGIAFDTAVWDTDDYLVDIDASTYIRYKGIAINEPGVYLFTAGAAIQTNIPITAKRGSVITLGRIYKGTFNYSFASYFLSYRYRRNYIPINDTLYYNVSNVVPMKAGDILHMSYTQRVARSTLSSANYIRSVVTDGYPYLSWIKIAPESTVREGWRGFWYYDNFGSWPTEV